MGTPPSVYISLLVFWYSMVQSTHMHVHIYMGNMYVYILVVYVMMGCNFIVVTLIYLNEAGIHMIKQEYCIIPGGNNSVLTLDYTVHIFFFLETM